MNIVEIIFRSFWTFSGAVILLYVLFDGVAQVVRAFRKDKR